MIDLTGQRFGRLTVIRESSYRSNKSGTWWECQCECGKIVNVLSVRLRYGTTKSCGCLRKENKSYYPKNRKKRKPISEETREKFRQNMIRRNTTHGLSKTKEHKAWRGMKNRCFNIKDRDYKNWGGRGITVCDRWKSSFANFLSDMGKAPEGYSLDRINNNGNYEPSNCRWADNSTQRKNTRSYVKSLRLKFYFCNWFTVKVKKSKLSKTIYA